MIACVSYYTWLGGRKRRYIIHNDGHGFALGSKKQAKDFKSRTEIRSAMTTITNNYYGARLVACKNSEREEIITTLVDI